MANNGKLNGQDNLTSFQGKLIEDKDEFVESLNLTPEKIRNDLEKMRDMEGFPIGDIENILELSDPPYYTAYPNPYIKDFIETYGTPYDEETDEYDVEPFVGDVSEGKNDPIYRAHIYHTKVPFKAITKFIEHYTNPGDIVFDGFCGSGMTGVASGLINRKAIISDLAPAATFISYNYTLPEDSEEFSKKSLKALKEVENECKWMFETNHSEDAITINGEAITSAVPKNLKCDINYTLWSDVFLCPFCNDEYIFWNSAISEENWKVNKNFNCPNCEAEITKNSSKRATQKIYDDLLKKEIEVRKQIPAMIVYSYNGVRYKKIPDEDDLELLKRVEKLKIPYWLPINQIMFKEGKWGDTWRKGYHYGISNVHHFYTKRNLYVLSAFASKMGSTKNFVNVSSVARVINKMYRFTSQKGILGAGGGPLSGTMYIPSLIKEIPMIKVLKEHVQKTIKLKDFLSTISRPIIQTASHIDMSNIKNDSVDYIFTDPPFGDNLMYSELNFIWDAWLKVFTNQKTEAIISNAQNKELDDYRFLMTQSFNEAYRILKPNRWITIIFHNSKAEIWKLIQNAIVKAGFIIAQVAVLDKKQGSFKQVTSAGSVKNDLIINAYKPLKSFSESFLKKAGFNMEKDFIGMHLHKLPIEPNIERTQQMLYSKLLAQYIQNGFEVRMDASEFYEMLRTSFEERDGYWFNKNQIIEYEEKTSLNGKLDTIDLDQKILGISDEKSAIIWLAQFLQTARTYDEIYTEFTKNLMTSQDKMPEIKTILDENFSTEGGKYRLPSDLERKEKEEVRDKRLIKEFDLILQEAQSKRKLKEVRKEALLHGLMKLYQEKNIEKIKLLAERLDRKIIDSDDDISAIIDWAQYK